MSNQNTEVVARVGLSSMLLGFTTIVGTMTAKTYGEVADTFKKPEEGQPAATTGQKVKAVAWATVMTGATALLGAVTVATAMGSSGDDDVEGLVEITASKK